MLNHLLIVLLSVQKLTGYFTGKISADERVIFFPTSASQWNTTHWHVPIHGWIFEPEEDSKKRKIFRSLLRRVLKVPSRSTEQQILDRRISPFVVDNERWKRPRIILGGKEYQMAPSTKNGHFHTSLILSNEDLAVDSIGDDHHPTESKYVKFIAASGDNSKKYEGMVHLVPSEGITILSDIDDTIKLTDVVHKREMLRNTFMREFKPVPGMADVYQKWCATTKKSSGPNHVHLHLLSASMYQLFDDLEKFRDDAGFPPATYSLKTVRPKQARQMIQILLEDATEYKRRTLTQIFETYPRRRFILVGDTGEKDPQVYAAMTKDYPRQILKICLRSVSKGETDDVQLRVSKIMEEFGIEDEKWTVFEDPSELLKVDLKKLMKTQ